MNNKELNIFRNLYNEHPEYKNLRNKVEPFYGKYIDDVKYWKVKYLESVFYEKIDIKCINSILEIGCATGYLLNTIFKKSSMKKIGVDISNENIFSAKEEFPSIDFFSGTFKDYINLSSNQFDIIVLSDILEHVEDDVQLLNQAGTHSKYILLNLPIEKVPEYENRDYGIDDIEGHLRAYSTDDAIKLCYDAGMEIVNFFERQYVLEPVFRKYLLKKIVEKNTSHEKALLEYTQETNCIELESDNYKRNFFALLEKTK